ncbi:TetR/AcrR family transcriptional regulator [Actinomyces sp. Marseille-P3109]|uniref:TetR/AcrR family transcriptional regulator n=1 Tax=Actinomyces sp. Marseille-P3109 TaxID=2083009 RepID=UPI000D54E91F|nr:TetR family transcriptional regulator C-terminal domain-containing protein [Actinomyces sp. Marseille-P3109]
MPKLIDHDRRREEIAEATWRVIHAEGISGVSIRTVAAEAGISTGSIRHVFPSKSELLTHATELVGRRAWVRIQRHLDEPDPRELVLRVLEELLPLDAERQLEMEVTVALIAEAPGDLRVREVLDESYETVREVCRRLIARLHRAGLTVPDLDVEAETTALHGVVDGLAIHLLINPDPGFRRQALRMVEAGIDRLRPQARSTSGCAPAAGAT